jgi:predicted molibdopterin-dependent oxidoreductase YjgC
LFILISWILQTLTESVLSTQNTDQSGRFTRSTANRSLFSKDKDNSVQVKFISSQTLRNTAAQKRDMRKKGGKV